MTCNEHDPPEVPDQSNTELIGWISCDGCLDWHHQLCVGSEADAAFGTAMNVCNIKRENQTGECHSYCSKHTKLNSLKSREKIVSLCV